MNKVDELEQRVRALYEQQDPNRDSFADWLYENHVFVVTDYAKELANRYGVDIDQCQAAAMTHDVADTFTSRFDEEHDSKSMKKAKELLLSCGFNDEDIDIVIEDALRYHSCHGEERPSTQVGKILATADSLAHLKTNFYPYYTWFKGKDLPYEELRERIFNKLDRDYYNKIQFDEVRKECEYDYKILKELYGRK